MDYRREIDGLRAVAVAAVVLGHADFHLGEWHPFAGGFVGVDVFFVISGYLITSILTREAEESGRISLLKFYERRARRILPALMLVCAAILPLAWLLLSPSQMKHFGASLVATAGFGSNFLFWLTSDYFAETTALKPLFHTWSLAVEEQYYVLFPLLLMWLLRVRWSVASTLLVLGLASLLTAVLFGPTVPGANFYLLPSRAWELLAGALISQLGRPVLSGWRLWLPSLGLGMIVASVAAFNAGTPHPGLLTLLPVVGTCLVIRYGGGRDVTTALLSSRPFVGVGLISYSLYLWHQPLFAFARVNAIEVVPQWEFAALIAVGVVLAALTYWFVEQPFRRRAIISTRTIWGASAAGMFSALGIGAAGVVSAGFPGRLPPALQELAHVPVGYTNLRGEDCFRSPCVLGAPGVEPSVMLIGDSHAAALAQSLDGALSDQGVAGKVEADGDIFLGRDFPAWYADAAKWNPVLARERQDVFSDEIETVILAGRFTLRLLNVAYDNGEGGVEALDSSYVGRTSEQIAELADSIRQGVVQLRAAGKRVILVYPVPEVGWVVPDTISKMSLRGLDDGLTTDFERYRARNKVVTDLFDSLLGADTIAVRPSEIFCDTFVPRRCATYTTDGILYHDDDHLSAYGADLVMKQLVSAADRAWGGIAPSTDQTD